MMKTTTELKIAKALLVSLVAAAIISAIPEAWFGSRAVVFTASLFAVLLLFSWVVLLVVHIARLVSADSRARYGFLDVLILFCVPLAGPAITTFRLQKSPTSTPPR